MWIYTKILNQFYHISQVVPRDRDEHLSDVEAVVHAAAAVAQDAGQEEGGSGHGPAFFAPGEITTGDDESHPTFTPDGRALYFLKNTPDFQHWTVVVSRLEGGHWTTPEVAPFSGRYDDADVSFTTEDSWTSKAGVLHASVREMRVENRMSMPPCVPN